MSDSVIVNLEVLKYQLPTLNQLHTKYYLLQLLAQCYTNVWQVLRVCQHYIDIGHTSINVVCTDITMFSGAPIEPLCKLLKVLLNYLTVDILRTNVIIFA